jgi:hypothetical protein
LNPPMPDFAAAAAAGTLRFVQRDIREIQRLTCFPDTEPWWRTDCQSRFDDVCRKFGVTYVAQRLETAFAETVIHEAGFHSGGSWLLPWKKIEERWIVRYSHPAKLTLIDLTGVQLKRLGLNNDISSTNDYAFTQELSHAVHEQVPQAQGIYYVSRQLNTQFVIALFQRSGVRCSPPYTRLDRHPGLWKVIRKFNVAFT